MKEYTKDQVQKVIELLWSDKHGELGLHHLLFEIIDPDGSMDINYGDSLDGFESEFIPDSDYLKKT
jgi:hypothetical protein